MKIFMFEPSFCRLNNVKGFKWYKVIGQKLPKDFSFKLNSS